MSNIKRASANIKKKLTLQDYRHQASQQESKPVVKQTGMPVHKHAGNKRPASKPADLPVPQQAVVPVKRQQPVSKMKATFYLGEQENKMLTQLFINSLRRSNKVDKSALVCQAIRLLYERDN